MWGGQDSEAVNSWNNTPGMGSWQMQQGRGAPVPPMGDIPAGYGRPPHHFNQQHMSQANGQPWGFPQQAQQWRHPMPEQQQMRMYGKPNMYPNVMHPSQSQPHQSWNNPKMEGSFDVGLGTSKDIGQWGAQPGIQHSQQPPAQQWGNDWQNSGSGVYGRQEAQWHQPQQSTQMSSTGQWQTPTNEQPRIDTFNPNGSVAAGSWTANSSEAPTSDMFWQDPNPKNKRQIKDTGTSYWGDPLSQQDIRRWKNADHEEFQKGPQTSTWTVGPVGWGELPETWRPSVWESNSLQESESRAAYPDEKIRAQAVLKSQELLDQIHRAVAKGYLKADIMNQQLPADKIRSVNNLLQRIYRMEQAESELEHIRRNIHRDFASGVTGSVSKQEYDRLAVEVEQLRMDISVISSDIQNDGQRQNSSRLQQWQKKNNSDSGYEQLAGALHSLGISDQTPWASETSREYVNPAPVASDQNEKSLSLNSPSDSASGLGGPREFVPGKKWEWKDPSRSSADVDATSATTLSPFPSQSYPGWNDSSDQ